MELTFWHWAIIIGIFLFFFIASVVTSFIILSRLTWNYKYVDAENIAGNGYVITKRGRARLVSFGDGGEEIFMLKGSKKYRVAYGKRIGKNQVMWLIGSDGYPYNCSFGDLNKQLLEVGVFPVDRDMRYAYASIRKGIDNRYDKKNFMEKYGTYIAFGMLFFCILAMGGFLWLGFNKQKDIVTASAQSMETAKEVMELAKEVLANLDNIKYGGSGFVPATTTT
jgi:hypothetical protein